MRHCKHKHLGFKLFWAGVGAFIAAVAMIATLATSYIVIPSSYIQKHPATAQRHDLGNSEVTPEGWLLIYGVTESQMSATCPLPPGDKGTVRGCALWNGPLFLAQPATSCLILIRGDMSPADVALVVEFEKRHCREGAYHDAENREIPKALRDALLSYNLPGITR